MKARNTFFGSLEPVLIVGGKLVAELATFKTDGKYHTHDQYEDCTIVKGEGTIMVEEEMHYLKAGSTLRIPPGTPHRMVVNGKSKKTWQILIVYADR